MQKFAVLAIVLLATAIVEWRFATAGYYGPLETKTGLSDSAKQYILCEHNRIRASIAKGSLKWRKAQPTAANMQCLCWCDELVPKAQKHASNCGGPSHDARSERFSENFKDVGQSLMDTMKSAPIDEAMDAFSIEANGYIFDTNACDTANAGPAHVCGHYTALAWATTQCVGCAYDACEGSANGRLVCNYGPGGNIQGERPYKQGQPCSACYEGQKCVDGGLCCNCDKAKCAGEVTQAVSEGAAGCSDVLSACPQYEAAIGVCQSSSPYFLWASQNCRQTCKMCGGADTGKVCNAAFNVSNDFCKVHSSENAAECTSGNGLFYAGRKSQTSSGYNCLKWSAQTRYHDFEFPERNRTAASNFCRNPGASGSAPWCYVSTGDTAAGWEYCSLPAC